jgi:hypothetical protein
MATTALPDQLSDETRDFVSREHTLIINGEQVPAEAGPSRPSTRPTTG